MELFRKYKTPIVLLIAFNTLAILLWLFTRFTLYLFLFSYIGTSIGVLGILSIYLPRERRTLTRRITQLLIGIILLVYIQFILVENMQIEGFWLFLFGSVPNVVEKGIGMSYPIGKQNKQKGRTRRWRKDITRDRN